ncbi:unnamed protein product [Ambrosiozyma monospora]|uniref:Unnamed protein product n=1 Tax=Ambrosiozyma monospora TaxID=43982 RepID=A0A9W6YTL2_AMBMO|nr:unnamed protein product [Ambrosiozyma monospora]
MSSLLLVFLARQNFKFGKRYWNHQFFSRLKSFQDHLTAIYRTPDLHTTTNQKSILIYSFLTMPPKAKATAAAARKRKSENGDAISESKPPITKRQRTTKTIAKSTSKPKSKSSQDTTTRSRTRNTRPSSSTTTSTQPATSSSETSTKPESKPIKPLQKQNPPNHTIYIKNINDKIPKSKTIQNLYILFTTYADVISVEYKNKGKLRGQAWITLSSVDEAQLCLSRLDGQLFFGRRLSLGFSTKEGEIIRYYENLDKKDQEQEQSKGNEDDNDDEKTALDHDGDVVVA